MARMVALFVWGAAARFVHGDELALLQSHQFLRAEPPGCSDCQGKMLIRVIMDSTCSDCQDWVKYQFKPLWEDEEFRSFFSKHYRLQFVATTVTQHKQGHALNQAINFAFSDLSFEAFLQRLFCWETNVHAYTPLDDGSFMEMFVDVNATVDKCKLPSPPAESATKVLLQLERAADAKAWESWRNGAPQPAEVPWLSIGGQEYSLEKPEGQHGPIHHLKDFLCRTEHGDKPGACAALVSTGIRPGATSV